MVLLTASPEEISLRTRWTRPAPSSQGRTSWRGSGDSSTRGASATSRPRTWSWTRTGYHRSASPRRSRGGLEAHAMSVIVSRSGVEGTLTCAALEEHDPPRTRTLGPRRGKEHHSEPADRRRHRGDRLACSESWASSCVRGGEWAVEGGGFKAPKTISTAASRGRRSGSWRPSAPSSTASADSPAGSRSPRAPSGHCLTPSLRLA